MGVQIEALKKGVVFQTRRWELDSANCGVRSEHERSANKSQHVACWIACSLMYRLLFQSMNRSTRQICSALVQRLNVRGLTTLKRMLFSPKWEPCWSSSEQQMQHPPQNSYLEASKDIQRPCCLEKQTSLEGGTQLQKASPK